MSQGLIKRRLYKASKIFIQSNFSVIIMLLSSLCLSQEFIAYKQHSAEQLTQERDLNQQLRHLAE